MIINGVDAFDEYGIIMRPGCDKELLKMPPKKPGYAYDWGDEDGIETDPDEIPVFERKICNLPLTILATGIADFNTKYSALTVFLKNAKQFDLDITHLGRRFKVRYKDMNIFEKLTNFHNAPIGVNITLQLTDDYPDEEFLIGTPDAPTLDEITLNEDDEPELSWVEGAEGSSSKLGNKIQRRESGEAFADLATTTGSGATYTDGTVEEGKMYYYRVATRNTQGYSPWSNVRSIISYAPLEAPTITVQATAVGQNTITVS